MTELSFGQKYDEKTGLIMPWFTHGALYEIKSMDLSDKNVLMYGAGLGDAWLASRCKDLAVIERNPQWVRCAATNLTHHIRPCNDCEGKDEYYLAFPEGFEPDVIISDDAYRYEAVVKAVEYFKNKKGGGILICDNYNQDYVWRCPKALELLEPFEKHIHIQEDHRDFETEDGMWKTAIIFIK